MHKRVISSINQQKRNIDLYPETQQKRKKSSKGVVFEFLLIVKASSLGSMQTSYFRVILYLENHQENKAKNKEWWLFTCGVLSSP